MNNDKFNFFMSCDIPDDIYKASYEAVGEERYKNMIVSGLASDSSLDADEQILEPDGFDFKDFLKGGLVNLEHFTSRKNSPQFWIGEPIDGYVKNNEFFVKSKLWEKHPIARELWDTLLIMKASGSTRKVGYSIEGKTLLKDPKNKNWIKKAKISHVAITFTPKNKNSWLDIVKGGQTEDFIEPEVETIGNSKYVYTFEKGCKTYGVTKSFEVEEVNEEEDEEKAETADSTAILRPESVDKRVHKQQVIIKSLKNKIISPKQALFLLKKFQG